MTCNTADFLKTVNHVLKVLHLCHKYEYIRARNKKKMQIKQLYPKQKTIT